MVVFELTVNVSQMAHRKILFLEIAREYCLGLFSDEELSLGFGKLFSIAKGFLCTTLLLVYETRAILPFHQSD